MLAKFPSVGCLNSKLENMTKSINMLNKGSDMLDEVLQLGKKIGGANRMESVYFCTHWPNGQLLFASKMTNQY